MTVFQTLVAPIMPLLQQIEHERPKHWNETFRWVDFVRILIFYFTKRCGSRNALIIALENADPVLEIPAVPAMTLTDAFRRFPAALLRQVCTQLMGSLDLPDNPELALIGTIHAVDGSEFPVVGGMQLPIAVSADDASAIKLHLAFNLNRMFTADFVIGTPNSSERASLRQMLEKGVTYVIDRGYMAFDLLRDIIAAQASVVMRAYNNIIVETVTDLPVVLPDAVQGHWNAVRDRIVQSSHPDAQGILFRLVECTVGTTTYRLITNRLDISTFQVILLYAYRWQIELIFRFFKHTLNGVDIITQHPNGIENFFYAMFLTTLLHLKLKNRSLEQDGHTPPAADISSAQTNDTSPDEVARIVQTSNDTKRTTVHLAIARFMSDINNKLALFWKIPKHWLATVADYLHREYTPYIVSLLNKRALAYSNRL